MEDSSFHRTIRNYLPGVAENRQINLAGWPSFTVTSFSGSVHSGATSFFPVFLADDFDFGAGAAEMVILRLVLFKIFLNI